MARQRDYAAEYARRQAKARAEGFRSYGAKRVAKEKQAGKARDYAAEYRRRVARARAEGFDSLAERQKLRRKQREAFEIMRSVYGGEPKWNGARTKARIFDMEEEDVDKIIEEGGPSIRAIMSGHPSGHDPAFYYH